MSFTLHGIAISGGYAIGRAQLYTHDRLEAPHYLLDAADLDDEVRRYEAALDEVRRECSHLRDHLPEGTPPELAAFLDLHSLFLDDSMLAEVPKRLIREQSCNAEWALAQQTSVLLAQFDSIEDAYLRERRHDVKQVADRVLKALLGHPGHAPLKPVEDEPTILVAHDLSPSDMVLFKRHAYAGFITDLGGATSHSAILARSLNISSVMALHNARALIQEGDTLIVDGVVGVVIVNPDESILDEYRLRHHQWRLEQQKLRRLKSSPSSTLDGIAIDLLANIDLPPDVREALEENASGIGLFRSEFLFLNRADQPSEDEQFEAYRHVVKVMKGRPVVIRTLDAGADKSLAWLPNKSDNPALGLRAIRLCLAEPQLFITQLRAILRASQYGPTRILLPMLASLTELDQALALIEAAKAELKAEKIKFDPATAIGGMIEIPAAALAAEWFARKLDFLSLGTNDLIQYTLAIDRTDDAVAHLYDPLNPGVIQLIAHTLKVGRRLDCPISVCGEMAGDPRLTRLLLGLGLRSFSMHPAHILAVKQQILRSQTDALEPLVAKMLRLGDPVKIQALLAKINA